MKKRDTHIHHGLSGPCARVGCSKYVTDGIHIDWRPATTCAPQTGIGYCAACCPVCKETK